MVAAEAQLADVEYATGKRITAVLVPEEFVLVDVLGPPEQRPAADLERGVEQERVSGVPVVAPEGSLRPQAKVDCQFRLSPSGRFQVTDAEVRRTFSSG